jgi:hypothetical protein
MLPIDPASASSVKRARTTFVTILAGDSITLFSDLSIEPSPDRHGKWDMENRRNRPQEWQASREVSECIGTTVAFAIPGYDPHLLHEHLVGEVRVIDRDAGVVQGNESQSIFAVEPTKMFDLSPAEIALAIEENDVQREMRWRRVVFEKGRMAHE